MFGPVEQSKLYPLFFKMPTGLGHYFGRQQVGRFYGQKVLIAFLMQLSEKWVGLHQNHPFGIGDLANPDGSPMKDHYSHSTGVAADIFIIHQDGVRRDDTLNMITYKDAKYDKDRTTDLAKLIAVLTQQFRHIQFLYNDPDVRKAVTCSPPVQEMLVPDHSEHIHVLLNGIHPYSDDELDRILGLKSRRERLEEYLQQLLTGVQMLFFGSTGSDVYSLQALLNHIGSSQLPALEEDGIFGSKTSSRVKEFQQQRQLTVDGIVGPKTKRAMAERFAMR